MNWHAWVKCAGENSEENINSLHTHTNRPDIAAYQNCVLHSVNLCNYVYVKRVFGFQHRQFATLRCISMGNSIKFGIDQKLFYIWLGFFNDIPGNVTLCFSIFFCVFHLLCLSVCGPNHKWNVSISVEKFICSPISNCFTWFDFFSLYVWLYVFGLLLCLLFRSVLPLHHLHLTNCFYWHSESLDRFFFFFLVENKWFFLGTWINFSKRKE